MIIKKHQSTVSALQKAIRDRERKMQRVERQLEELQKKAVKKACDVSRAVI